MSILFIDDSNVVLKFIEKQLSNYQINIQYVNCPELALQFINKYNYDIIISDINMPKINGYELEVEIKKINPKILVILISSMENIKKYPIFIKKPLDIPIFIDMINNYIDLIS